MVLEDQGWPGIHKTLESSGKYSFLTTASSEKPHLLFLGWLQIPEWNMGLVHTLSHKRFQWIRKTSPNPREIVEKTKDEKKPELPKEQSSLMQS